MSELMSREEAAELLGIKPNSVRDTLRRYGITEQRGYPREAVENLKRPGRGYRSDLKENHMVTITDTETGQSATVEKYDVAETIRPWFEAGHASIDDAINRLEAALLQGKLTIEYEAFLHVRVEPATTD